MTLSRSEQNHRAYQKRRRLKLRSRCPLCTRTHPPALVDSGYTGPCHDCSTFGPPIPPCPEQARVVSHRRANAKWYAGKHVRENRGDLEHGIHDFPDKPPPAGKCKACHSREAAARLLCNDCRKQRRKEYRRLLRRK